ncbi:MAG: hypothetical protein ACLFQZ_14430 [Spirochaetaceae bacterium]
MRISHESGDEGESYLSALMDFAHAANVDLRLVATVLPDVVNRKEQPIREILGDREYHTVRSGVISSASS